MECTNSSSGIEMQGEMNFLLLRRKKSCRWKESEEKKNLKKQNLLKKHGYR